MQVMPGIPGLRRLFCRVLVMVFAFAGATPVLAQGKDAGRNRELECRVSAAEKREYDNAWDYCRAVRTKPEIAERRWAPDASRRKIFLQAARMHFLSEDAPESLLVAGLHLRCMDGAVWACHVGANIPCGSKGDKSRKPARPIRDFCRENPGAKSVPAYVTGRTTLYEWVCRGSTPVIKRVLFSLDKDGYISDFWAELPRPQ